MLILAGEVHHLIDLCLGDFVAEYPAYTHAPLMDVKHDAGRLFNVHLEKALQDEDNERHRSIIVVQHQYLIRRRLFGARARTGGDAPIAAIIIRSEEHTSEIPSLMRTSYAVFCLE